MNSIDSRNSIEEARIVFWGLSHEGPFYMHVQFEGGFCIAYFQILI